MKSTTPTIQIINGPDMLDEIRDVIAQSTALQVIKSLGSIYIDKRAALQILELKSASSVDHHTSIGKKDRLGRTHKLNKHYPFDNNRPAYLLDEVIAYKMIK